MALSPDFITLAEKLETGFDESFKTSGKLFILNSNFVYMSDGNAWEKGWNDLRDRNDNYTKKGYICLQEKVQVRQHSQSVPYPCDFGSSLLSGA